VETCHNKDLVRIALGDHQPTTIVSRQGASHDVPITIIAQDPAVMSQISRWAGRTG
jgi:hypothetical protein